MLKDYNYSILNYSTYAVIEEYMKTGKKIKLPKFFKDIIIEHNKNMRIMLKDAQKKNDKITDKVIEEEMLDPDDKETFYLVANYVKDKDPFKIYDEFKAGRIG